MYEKLSIIITSNKSFENWAEMMGDSIMTTALLDRLLHHARIFNLNGESYRIKNQKKGGIVISNFFEEMGKLLTRLLGNYLTEALGKVLDIYRRRVILHSPFLLSRMDYTSTLRATI